MIHFFPTFSDDARNSPFAQALENQGVAFKLFSSKISLRYRNRIWLLLVGWPRMVLFALNSSYRSLLRSDSYPDVVVLGSHIEVIVFSVIRFLRLRRQPAIVLLGFIYTKRGSPLKNSIREIYFKLVFSFVSKVICHSRLEVAEYSRIFKRSKARFVFIPYGMHVDGSEEYSSSMLPEPETSNRYLLTAGRSGRDYSTLIEAIRGLDIQLHLICDSDQALKDIEFPPNVTVLRNCYDEAYIEELRNAWIVVLPLAEADISAGQMVLLQAMSFGKPVVITKTPTVVHYVEAGVDALLVEQANVEQWRETLQNLVHNAGRCRDLGCNARRSYEQKFSMEAYVGNMIDQIKDLL